MYCFFSSKRQVNVHKIDEQAPFHFTGWEVNSKMLSGSKATWTFSNSEN